jgi:urease accessory protein
VADASARATPQLLRLLHLASPALPIGAFHFSQGLEYAVECGWVKDEDSALDWIGGLASANLATLDLPVLERLRSAWRQDARQDVLRWNAFLIASRETEELRAEDRHLGSALLRVLIELGLTTEIFPLNAANTPPGVSHASAFAFACARWNVAPCDCSLTYAWAWVRTRCWRP